MTKIEKLHAEKQRKDRELFIKYKQFLAGVKNEYLKKGPFAAQIYIRNNANLIIEIAADDLYSDILYNLDL